MMRESRQNLLSGLVLCVVVISAPAAFSQWVACSPGTSVTCTTAAAGIGTTTPASKLHVSTTGNADGIAVDGTMNPSVNFREAGVVKGYLGLATTQAGYFASARAGDLALRSESSRILIGQGFQDPTLTVDGANLGVGTTAPGATLQVAGDLRIGSNGTNKDVRIFSDVAGTLNNGVAYAQVNSITPVTIPASGTTRTALYLKNATAVGQGTNQIDLVVDGSITGATVLGAVYQDLAEWVPSRDALHPGTVVVVDPDAMNGVLASSSEYQTTVAGVVSAAPGVLLGVAGPSKEMVATTGRVKVRVTASNGSIRAGDLLVTSDQAGMAMKSEPVNLGGVKMHRPGTLIGKALEPLEKGENEILVLLSLQ